MATLTIPRKFTKGEELIIIPRREYERILRFPIKNKLDSDIEDALEDVRAGRLLGPFKTVKEFKESARQHSRISIR